jgi:outer membrane protein assembly factor BamB
MKPACLFGVAALAVLVVVAPSPADWPVFRGSPEMSGVAAVKPRPDAAAGLPDQLAERWTFKTGNAIDGAPALVAGVVFVASADKHLYAVDLKTGQQKWKVKLGAPMKASPAFRGNRVYVGDVDGKLYCLDAADGKKHWEFETQGEIVAGVNFHKDNILLGSHDSTLYCLKPDGTKAWEYRIDGPVNGSPAVAGDRVFVAGCDSILHLVDANSGKNLGTVDLGGQAGATAAVAGDQVYVGTMTNQVVGIDWKKQAKLWAFEAPRRQQPFYASAAVTDALVVTGSRDKKVYAIHRDTGKEAWNFVTDGVVDASPVVVGGRVYVGCQSNDGNFYVLDLKTGGKVQELNLDSAVTGSVAVGPDCVLVGTEKGTLYCLGAK